MAIAGSGASAVRAARGKGAGITKAWGGAVAAVQQLAHVLHLPWNFTSCLLSIADGSWQLCAAAGARVAHVANTAAPLCTGRAAISIHSRQRTKNRIGSERGMVQGDTINLAMGGRSSGASGQPLRLPAGICHIENIIANLLVYSAQL
ncbi:hypothetical protein GCM10027277_07280 [Pseudoduganella ginsengisoli]